MAKRASDCHCYRDIETDLDNIRHAVIALRAFGWQLNSHEDGETTGAIFFLTNSITDSCNTIQAALNQSED